MEVEVETHDERPELLEDADLETKTGLVILPTYSPFSENSDAPVDATEAANVEKLWEQNGVESDRVEGEGTLVQFSDITSLPPLYATFEFLRDNPEIVVIAFESLALYYERRTSDGVELDMTVESEEETTSLKYSGPAEGLKNLPSEVFEELGIESGQDEEEEADD